MIDKQKLLDLVVDLAVEVATEAEWEIPFAVSRGMYSLIANSMIEIHLGDERNYSVSDTEISLLATTTFLSVQNMSLFRLLMDDWE